MLDERVAYLAEYLAIHSDHKHADLSYETTYARATADVSEEYCAEFAQKEASSDAESHT